jgi:prepilin-type N-terminal cleavage/methylation domain-containing protein
MAVWQQRLERAVKTKMHDRFALMRTSAGNQCGATLIETMIALVILAIGLLGAMGLIAFAVTQNWNMGDRSTRTTEYAQDKMEQLLALNFTDGSSNTTVYPTTTTGGTGLGGVMPGSSTVGGVTSGSPVSQYVDYIDTSGNLQTTSTNAIYIRQWMISTNASANLKTVTVVVTALTSSNGGGAPSTTLVSMKSQ